MSNGKLWLGLKEDNPKLVNEWVREENIDVCACRISGSGLLHWSAQLGAVKVAGHFLQEIPVDTPDADGERAVQAAARTGEIAILNRLFKAGAEVNAQSNDGRTAAMIAVARGQLAYLKRLVTLGADLSILDNAGHTAVDYAPTKKIRLYCECLKNPTPVRVASSVKPPMRKPALRVATAKKVHSKEKTHVLERGTHGY